MKAIRRIACVLVGVLPVFAVWAALARGAAEPAAVPDFHALLEQAADAYDRGDEAEARARLREASRAVTSDEFHKRLADAADEYDHGRPQRARASLKDAVRSLNPWFWLALGFVAQAMFVGRFAVQWIASERRGESVVPVAFWYFSLLGSWGLLAYALWRQDAVIILGQAFNTIIYVRNLMLISRKRRAGSAEASRQEPSE